MSNPSQPTQTGASAPGVHSPQANPPTTAAHSNASPPIPTSYRWFALGLLTLVYITNFVDRQILSILLPEIKEAFNVSDTALGFLSGISFALFYATLGIPIAMWADRGNRRNIITLALSIFSIMTALCGMASSFVQLAAARIGVGVGEAGASPPSHSIIADLFPPNERGTAMGIFATGVNIGIMIGFFVGGWINELYGWRSAFMAVGMPGLIIAAIVRITLKEPIRGASEGRATESQVEAPSVKSSAMTFMRTPALRHIALGAALNSFVGYGAITWLPTFLDRSYAMSSSDIGTYLSLIIGVGGGLGTFLGGYLADILSKRDVRWNLWLPAVAILAALPFTFGVYLSDTASATLLYFIIPAMVGTIYLGPCLAMVQALVPLRMRTVASAILLFVVNIIGMGLGPQVVGIISDLLTEQFRLRIHALCTLHRWFRKRVVGFSLLYGSEIVTNRSDGGTRGYGAVANEAETSSFSFTPSFPHIRSDGSHLPGISRLTNPFELQNRSTRKGDTQWAILTWIVLGLIRWSTREMDYAGSRPGGHSGYDGHRNRRRVCRWLHRRRY